MAGIRSLAIVVSHPTQYYSPWFRWLAEHTDLRLRVFYLWEFGVTKQRDPKFQTAFKWDVDLLSGYDCEFVPNAAPRQGTDHFGGLDNPTISARLASWAPDAILLFGYKWRTHLRVIAWARRRRVPLIFRGDSHFLGRGVPAWHRRIVLRLLYAQFSAFLRVGTANSEYFSALGVPSNRQHFAPHSVNAELFNPQERRHRDAAAATRENLGIPAGTRVLLFVGKLVPEKQPRALLEAYLGAGVPNTALIVGGDGPEKPELQAIAAAGSGRTVHFLPFANQSEMPSRYLAADVFALPSAGLYETWGLAVNEAMHMGRPCLVSDRVGCQRDLVEPGVTGWVFDATDRTALHGAVRAALTASETELARMRERVMQRIAGYTYEQTTAGLLHALNSLPAWRT